jgi:predicted O-linked N-acetylglucosamine transferase (SPINDLY family)
MTLSEALEAVRFNPFDVQALTNLGILFASRGQTGEAVTAFRRAVALRPHDANLLNNLGNSLRDLGHLDEAISTLRAALQADPAHARAYNNLGNALGDRGLADEAVACYRQALVAAPGYVRAHDNLLCTLQYCPGVGLADLAAAHTEFDRLFAAPLRPTAGPHVDPPEPGRPLRLGFVSADLGRHPVGHFLLGFLENVDRKECQTTCYSDRHAKDEITRRLEQASADWRDVPGLDDDALAEQVRADRIDVLVDLGGHTAGNRLLVFARRPAPVQVTWLGYVGTTGLSAMDYLIADRWEIPPGQEGHFREKVLRLPDGYLCYLPPDEAPAVGELPALRNGRVTFGSFNNPIKINPSVVVAWAEILRRVAGARLLLKYRGFDDPGTRDRYETLFADQGVTRDRLELHGWSPHRQHLEAYHRVDIALDPFPYSGGLTTCEALWMGVPVVTCPGETFASRHSLSHLSNAGLSGTVAKDMAEYVDLAIGLAANTGELARVRREQRERVARSPLCDCRRFAHNLVQALLGIRRERSR